MSDKENPTSEPAKKGSKKFIIIAVVFVLLIGGAGGGFYFWRTSSASAAEDIKAKKASKKLSPGDEETGSEEKKSGKKDGPLKDAIPDDEDVKTIVELPAFIVNLADAEQARYLRMTVSLGVAGAEDKNEKPDQLFMTRVRNAMLAVLSDKKSDEILSVEGKTKLRKELLEAAQAASESPHVQAIYITDFIVQL